MVRDAPASWATTEEEDAHCGTITMTLRALLCLCGQVRGGESWMVLVGRRVGVVKPRADVKIMELSWLVRSHWTGRGGCAGVLAQWDSVPWELDCCIHGMEKCK